MTNPHLTVNLFKIRTKNAVVGMTHTANVIGLDGNQSISAALVDHSHHMNTRGQKGYIGFTSDRRNHQKEDIEYCSAVMVEYPYRDIGQLTERLSQLPYATTRSTHGAVKASAPLIAKRRLPRSLTVPSEVMLRPRDRSAIRSKSVLPAAPPLCSVRSIEIKDWERLAQEGGFDSAFLHISDELPS